VKLDVALVAGVRVVQRTGPATTRRITV